MNLLSTTSLLPLPLPLTLPPPPHLPQSSKITIINNKTGSYIYKIYTYMGCHRYEGAGIFDLVRLTGVSWGPPSGQQPVRIFKDSGAKFNPFLTATTPPSYCYHSLSFAYLVFSLQFCSQKVTIAKVWILPCYYIEN